MLLDNPERYNFYKLENMIKEDPSKFINYLNDLLKTEGIDSVISAIKSTGFSINIFNEKKQKDKFLKIIKSFYNELEIEGKFKIIKLLKESAYFNKLFNFQGELRKKYFEENGISNDRFEVVSYLISLELYLKEIDTDNTKVNNEKFITKENLFDSAIESTGMILKNFMYTKSEFTGSKRNISPKIIEITETHILFSNFWNELNDVLEYWKYSEVEITEKDDGKIYFNITDDTFELNNHISNERFLNLRHGWQFNEITKILSKYNKLEEEKIENLLLNSNKSLDTLFATLYFGSPLLNEKIEGLLLTEWIKAYQLLKSESDTFLKKQKKIQSLNLEKVCLSKTEYEWKKLFMQSGFTKEQSEEIIRFFTFNSKSLDLVDCPFIKVDDKLVVVPTLTKHADTARALASNFLNRDVNLSFKGQGFEDRTKVGLLINGITTGSLYKRTNGTEYECDVAFILEDDLFFIECKAHVQPFTGRQHANHLYKLYKETYQINRIADFFETNIQIVKEQLDLNENFSPKNIYRILLTTSMIGTPMFINGVYIVDESSFTMFIDRNPPSLTYVNEGKSKKYSSTRFDIFNGELTSQKLIDFLSAPPQIDIIKDFYKKTEIETELWDINRNTKVNQTIHFDTDLSDSEKSLILNNFGEIDLENI